jgi:uncharacterized protein (TIGR02246 family)
MSSKNKEIIEKVNAAFAEGNIEGFLSFCAEDAEWQMVGDKAFKGKEAIREFMSSMEHTGMEPPKFTVNEVIAEGDSVVAYGDMTMEEDGETVPYSYVDVYQFRDDKIIRLQSFIVKHKTEDSAQKAAV